MRYIITCIRCGNESMIRSENKETLTCLNCGLIFEIYTKILDIPANKRDQKPILDYKNGKFVIDFGIIPAKTHNEKTGT